MRAGEPFALGLSALAQPVPRLLVTLPAGCLADLLDRRKLMIVDSPGAPRTLVALAVFGHVQGTIRGVSVTLVDRSEQTDHNAVGDPPVEEEESIR